MKSIHIRYLTVFTVFMLSTGCTKDFLDKKPSTDIVQPNTLDDFQNLLENGTITQTTALGIFASDEYVYKSFEVWQSTPTATERNSYIWAKDIFQGEIAKRDWSLPYSTVFYANNVLAGLTKIDVTDFNRTKWNTTKGWALFIRANAYHDLVRNFSAAYDPTTAATELGVPVRLNPSIGEILPRFSIQETFDRILVDVSEAEKLLESTLPKNRNRPSKAAAYALAARVYLNMREYGKAELSADNCLKLNPELMDYNTLSLTNIRPFLNLTNELLYFTIGETYSAYLSGTNNRYISAAPELIGLYEPNDLRLDLFFIRQPDNSYNFKSNVSGTSVSQPFTGLAMDEIYLIKAECAARRQDVDLAMDYLNRLLIKRYKTNEFIPLTASSTNEALKKVLLERRKQLVFRGLRWDDLKRLNKEGANITLTRELNGVTYTLEPNSKKYVLPIPDDEILLGKVEQNQR